MGEERSVGVTIVSIIMLIYGLWLLGAIDSVLSTFLIPKTYELYSFFSPWGLLKAGKLKLISVSIGLIYLISSINILRLKNWARLFAVYLSGLITLGYLVVGLACAWTLSPLSSPANRQGWVTPALGALVMIIFLLPLGIFPLLFFIFFTRSNVKEQFGVTTTSLTTSIFRIIVKLGVLIMILVIFGSLSFYMKGCVYRASAWNAQKSFKVYIANPIPKDVKNLRGSSSGRRDLLKVQLVFTADKSTIESLLSDYEPMSDALYEGMGRWQLEELQKDLKEKIPKNSNLTYYYKREYDDDYKWAPKRTKAKRTFYIFWDKKENKVYFCGHGS